jgi:hypothetical protein
MTTLGIEPSYVFCFDYLHTRPVVGLDDSIIFLRRSVASCSTARLHGRVHYEIPRVFSCSRDLIDERTASMVYGVWMISSTSDTAVMS